MRKSSKVKDHKGIEYDSLSDMCKAYSVSCTTFLNRYNLGWTIEKALTKPSEKGIETDHNGRKYDSLGKMCKAYSISPSDFLQRINAGWTIEEALTLPLPSRGKKKATDHKGNEYDSVVEMCKTYSIDYHTYYDRLKKGWDVGKALETPVASKSPQESVADYNGNVYINLTEMCKAYSIPYHIYCKRIENGWTLEEALTMPVSENKVTDHKGRGYRTIKEMCKAYSISYERFTVRVKSGWSLEEALTTPVGSKSKWKKKVTDYKGNEYESIVKLCEAYSIPYSVYRNRVGRGWTLEEALTTPCGTKRKAVTDHNGKEYGSIIDMCKAYSIPYTTYMYRRKAGYSIEQALTEPNNNKKK